MPDSYTVLWSNHRIKLLRQHHQEGAPLEILFGGPHTSEPSFRRYGVQAGDYVYPLRVAKGVLYVLGRMQVRRILTLEEYIENHPQTFADGESGSWPMATFESYLDRHPEMRYLAPTCTTEVVLGKDGTPIRLDLPVPPDLLERLRFRSRKRERGLKYVENGRLLKVISLQGGVYRLVPDSARELESLLIDTP